MHALIKDTIQKSVLLIFSIITLLLASESFIVFQFGTDLVCVIISTQV